jgi:hypothetical protein
MSSSEAEVIEVLGLKGGVYFPLVRLDVRQLLAQDMTDQFMLRYSGQVSQLKVVPSPCERITPQDDKPEQALNFVTGGNPSRTDLDVVEKVTIFFATGQSKAVSDTVSPESRQSKVLSGFTPALLRGVTRDRRDGRVGISFNLLDDQVIRLVLDQEQAKYLLESLQDYLCIGSQSPMSSEIPSVEGSVKPGQSV